MVAHLLCYMWKRDQKYGSRILDMSTLVLLGKQHYQVSFFQTEGHDKRVGFFYLASLLLQQTPSYFQEFFLEENLSK